MPRRQHPQAKPSAHGKPGSVSPVVKDIRALNSSILVISQKLKYLVRNEKILGRNLLVLNKKLKRLEESGTGQTAASAEGMGDMASELGDLARQVQRNADSIAELQTELNRVQETYAKTELVKEIKYVIDTINPLDFVTYKDVERIVDEKLGKKPAKK